MKPTSIFSVIALILMMSVGLQAQKGTLRGTLYDDENGEKLSFANVIVESLGTGTTTDLDGAYSIKLPEGTYRVKFAYLGYSELVIEEVKITADDVTQLDARLAPSSQQLETVVITARQARDTEAALATLQRKSTNLLDGISSASFSKMGDSDAAAAIKRVPGVSIENGKYVFVRGLGDRYTKSILNGMEIPGLDPDRNTLQMDIFPTNILDNIIVLKTFTADLPADFTGGVVDITTKDFPEEKMMVFSAGIGYNPAMHYNDRYLHYEGGDLDFLGFDDGTREIPTARRENIPSFTDALIDPEGAGTEYRNILQSFNPSLAAMRTKSGMDFDLGFTMGNQINKEKVTWGYNLALAYKNTTEFYENAENSLYGKGKTSDVIELVRRERQIGDYGTNSVLLSGLAGISAKTKTSRYTLNVLHLQNGESKAGDFIYENTNLGAVFTAHQNNLEYSERSLTNIALTGTHQFQEGDWKIEWKANGSRSKIHDPDIRFTRYRTDSEMPRIGTEVGLPTRIWRFLNEDNIASRLDLTRKFGLFQREASFKFGGAYTYKTRSFEIQDFQFRANNLDLTGNFDELMYDDNLWSPENPGGVTFNPQFLPNNPNKFDGTIQNIAAYSSLELKPFDRLKSILGVRMEQYTQRYTGINQDNLMLNNEKVLDNLDFFPSINLIYELKENMNLRMSYSNTVARPSFKEASFATILDPLSNSTFIGGFFPDFDLETRDTIWDGNLQQSNINNYDLRWEMFQERGQLISVSAFYKTFENPIELVQFLQAKKRDFQPRNVGFGQVLGLEFEMRKSLGFISRSIRNFTVNANITLTESSIEMSETEIASRERFARDGQEIGKTRDMVGQAPYLINGGIAYGSVENGWQLGLYYNVQGSTLAIVGVADKPDVYTVPFHNLNFTVGKTFGKENRWNASLKAANLLSDTRQKVFKSFKAQDQIFSSFRPQRAFSLSLSYKM